MKQTKKATNHRRVPETLAQDPALTENVEGWRTEDEVCTTTQKARTQKMDLMMEMLLDLCHCVKASETQQRDRAASPLTSLSPPMLKEGGAGAR